MDGDGKEASGNITSGNKAFMVKSTSTRDAGIAGVLCVCSRNYLIAGGSGGEKETDFWCNVFLYERSAGNSWRHANSTIYARDIFLLKLYDTIIYLH